MTPYEPRGPMVTTKKRHMFRLTLLHKQFLALVIFVVMMTIALELLHNNMEGAQAPKYGLQPTLVTVDLDTRRLGNVMFSYAALCGIAKRNGMTPVVGDDITLNSVFNISALQTDNMEMTLGMYKRYEEYGRRASAYDIKTERLERWNTRLSGYFQSWRYFRNATKELALEYTFLPHIKTIAENFLSGNVPIDWHGKEFIRVGIHVRRGDLLTSYFQQYGYTVADKPYFQKAMAYFTDRYSNVQFVVCSDDIGWAKGNINGANVLFSEGHTSFEDMAILSLCNHSIVSVGSFGWWSAWLANGTTLYYEKWPKEYTKLEYHINKKDYFPPGWIPMS